MFSKTVFGRRDLVLSMKILKKVTHYSSRHVPGDKVKIYKTDLNIRLNMKGATVILTDK